MIKAREQARLRRHKRIRKHLKGTSQAPRLNVFRSLKNLNAQLVDDVEGKTIFSMSTLDKEFRKLNINGGNLKAAEALGELFAKTALQKGISAVIFDRGGYLYHGRIKSFAEGARKGGLKF